MIKMLAWRMRKLAGIHASFYKIILVDTKPVQFGQDDDLGHYWMTGGKIYRDWHQINLATIPNRLIIYRPVDDLINPEQFSQFFRRLVSYRYRSKDGKISPLPLLIIIDELIDVFSSEKTRTQYMQGFAKIMTQGRSSLQTTWILTQFPTFIDPAIKRNTTVYFDFALPDENDRKVMAGVMGSKLVMTLPPDPHGFFYENRMIPATINNPTYFSGTRERGGLRLVV